MTNLDAILIMIQVVQWAVIIGIVVGAAVSIRMWYNFLSNREKKAQAKAEAQKLHADALDRAWRNKYPGSHWSIQRDVNHNYFS